MKVNVTFEDVRPDTFTWSDAPYCVLLYFVSNKVPLYMKMRDNLCLVITDKVTVISADGFTREKVFSVARGAKVAIEQT